MSKPKEDVFDVVHEAFDIDEQQTRDPVGESPSLARQAVDAVLDLHHVFRGGCYECSVKANSARAFPSVSFPCPTVEAILKVVRPEAPRLKFL